MNGKQEPPAFGVVKKPKPPLTEDVIKTVTNPNFDPQTLLEPTENIEDDTDEATELLDS